MLDVGSEIEGYRIDGVLGHGGMGVVYEATQLALNRKVALKILASHLTADGSFRKRFQREGEIQAALDHPNIITVHAAGETDEGLYIAMRLVQGPNLKELIETGRLDPPRTFALLSQVADALDAAHEAGLIHRDVKPQNVLVDSRDHAYLADFGLTKGPNHSGLTKTNQFLGTIDYVSPEQILGQDAVPQSDIYALGGVLYECLTGNLPFPKPSDPAVMFAHLNDPPPEISAARPDLPAALDDVLARAMAKVPADRYSSASEFINAARSACQVTPVAGANRVAAATVASVPETLTDVPETVVDAQTLGEPAPTTGPQQSARRQPRMRRGLWVLPLALGVIAAGIGVLVADNGSASTPDQSSRTAANRDLAVHHPSSWQRSGAASPLGISAEHPISLKPRGQRSAGMLAGVSDATLPNLVPRRLNSRLTASPPSRERVRIGTHKGYRFPSLQVKGFPGPVTLYAIPTTAGVTTLTCYGLAAQTEAGTACEQIVGTVSLRRGTTGPIGPDRAFSTTLTGVMNDLNKARDEHRRTISEATTAAAVAKEAHSIAAAYATSEKAIQATRVSPEAVPARRSVAEAIQATRKEYTALAAAADKPSSADFSAASHRVRVAERQLQTALSELQPAGYKVGG